MHKLHHGRAMPSDLCDAISVQLLQLLTLADELNRDTQSLLNGIEPSVYFSPTLLPDVHRLLSNYVLFDNRIRRSLSDGDGAFDYEPVIYRAEPTISAAFIAGSLAAKALAASVAGAAGGVAAHLATKAMKRSDAHVLG